MIKSQFARRVQYRKSLGARTAAIGCEYFFCAAMLPLFIVADRVFKTRDVDSQMKRNAPSAMIILVYLCLFCPSLNCGAPASSENARINRYQLQNPSLLISRRFSKSKLSRRFLHSFCLKLKGGASLPGDSENLPSAVATETEDIVLSSNANPGPMQIGTWLGSHRRIEQMLAMSYRTKSIHIRCCRRAFSTWERHARSAGPRDS